jgi:8-oxo-dGTP pyrophosphatase MutT (NUDIX family)
MLNEKSAGAVVFYRGNPLEYLLLLSTYWGFAKGIIEADEDERAAAVREVREETGLEVTLLEGFSEVDDYWYQRKGQRVHKQAIYFLGQAHSRETKLSWEHKDIAWLTYEQAMEKLKFAGLRELLTKANDFLERNP